MKKLLFGALLLFVIAGCATNQETARLRFEDSVGATVGQCEQAATGSGSTDLLQERPNFGFRNQVSSLEELEVGEVYVWCHVPTGTATVYILASDPEFYYAESFGETVPVLEVSVVDYYYRWEERSAPTKVYLSDMGVVQYQNELWNPGNVLIRVEPGYVVDFNPG